MQNYLSDPTMMNLFSLVVLGMVAGFVVKTLDPGDVKGGVLATTLFGIAGAILGGFLSQYIFQTVFGRLSIEEIVSAVIGSFILAMIHRLMFRERNLIRTSVTRIP